MDICGFLSDLLGKEFKEKEPIANTAIEQVSTPLPSIDCKLDESQQELFDLIENTTQNIFIQGQAGSGKSTFINYLKAYSSKRIRVVCPTAVAAINIGGSTIHSLFNLPLSDFFIFDELIKTPRKKLKSILLKTDLLIIDEVSMVRPDMLDAIDLLSRELKEKDAPFGGLQLLLVGDLCQLPPVIKSNTYDVFKRTYGYRMPYFFDSNAYKNGNFKKIELTRVYRQEDTELLENLINIRKNINIEDSVAYFNTCKITDENILNTAITITPYRNIAENINQKRLGDLPTEVHTYVCQTKDSFDDAKDAPAPRVLTLKVGALVIFNKNNSPIWINGTSGIVEELEEDVIKVRILNNDTVVPVKREEWKNYAYDYDRDTGTVIEKEIGSFIQFPLQLGYALTIHKAQGKTLDKVIIEMSKGAFASGQLYVALSRTRHKADIHIPKRIDESDAIIDDRIVEFLG